MPASPATLHARLQPGPLGSGEPRTDHALAELTTAAQGLAGAELLSAPGVRDLLCGILPASPYLSGLVLRDPQRLLSTLSAAPEQRRDALVEGLRQSCAKSSSIAELMAHLRTFKSDIALLTALADLGGVWSVEEVTRALTEAADACVQEAVAFLFREAVAKGNWTDTAPALQSRSGFIVLGMGKYGGHELNYSSDIDIVVFYDASKARVRQGLEPQAFFVRLTRDLVKVLQERTGDGYVFRTDLRLRPDPGATQIALSTEAALVYYESFGQNWERAAMIKARAVAGDLDAGARLLADLEPFVWRKYLDFAAIADIHAMKRQIHAHRGFGVIRVAGHDIKVGRGGIREIEFFVQTQQLIAGGRQADLRAPGTLQALDRLSVRKWIKPEVRDDLAAAYTFLRGIEHRLQMVADEQTHVLPASQDDLERFARFAGYASAAELSRTVIRALETVQRHYTALFEGMPELARGGANMVFAGEADDPGTLEALGKMGFSNPSQVVATIRGWHHGRYPAVRSAVARERLTEVQPILIEALAATADPDAALAGFDRFLAELPTGVQLFALLRANTNLLRLVADIMGSAPRLARILSRRPRVLDGVLDPRVIGTLPSAEDLRSLIASDLRTARDLEEALDRARVIGSEQAFLTGVRLLSGMIRPSQAGGVHALLAEELIRALQRAVEEDFARVHGRIAGGAAAIVAMGKLGGREMTASSDLDLILVYDFDRAATQSDGNRPLPPIQYFARLAQRLVSALAAQTAEGRLYEVDMRLRPSGQKGPLATQLSSFIEYQTKEAWTWEHLALTRARVITGPAQLVAQVEGAIRSLLLTPRDRRKVAADVHEMRQRIVAHKAADSIWDIKQVRGGLVDLEFMAQYLQLIHAPAAPQVLDQNTVHALEKLERCGFLASEQASVLLPSARLLNDLTQIVRLCLEGPFQPETAPDGLKDLMARVADAPSFTNLEARLAGMLQETAGLFDKVIA